MGSVEQSRRWIWFLVGRTACYAVLGGLAMAVVGALFAALVGAFMGLELIYCAMINFPFLLDYQGYNWVNITRTGAEMLGLEYTDVIPVESVQGIQSGLVLGSICGGLTGLLTFGVHGFLSRANPNLLPPRHLFTPIGIGMGLAFIGMITSSHALFGVANQNIFSPLYEPMKTIYDYLVRGTPTVMMCGGIVGALWGGRRQKARQRNT